MESHSMPATDDMAPLLDAVGRGDTVVITRGGVPVAESRPAKPLDTEALEILRRKVRAAGMPPLDAVEP